jgi:TolB-like protein/predicted Ser/Thr protein kinase/Flp pilus assembly protein TadD
VERSRHEVESGVTIAAPSPSGAELPSDSLSNVPVPDLVAGRYRVLGLVASGGMGSVYRACDVELDEIVALKVLRPELIDTPEMLARFRQEVKLARRVTHGNVARTFDIGEHRGEKFLTMEFIDGASLADRIHAREHFSLARVVEIGLAICAGLTAAHAAGVVHRDLKPDNVLVTKAGRVVITDFGIARAVEGGSRHTMGAPVGTPAYMAPEQVEGGAVDHRADLYAFGEILFELCTSQPAWTGDSVFQVAAARLLRPPPDLRELRPDLPQVFGRIVLRCMARKVDDRYASAAEVAAELGTMTLPAVPSVMPIPPPAPSGVSLPGPTPPGEKTVAVLPFRHPGAPDDEYLADGLTEDLIDTLSVASGVRVRALGAVSEYKGRARDPRDIGRELGVQVVVEGSVRRSASGLRVTARVLSVADGFQLWAARFEKDAADFLSIGDEIAEAIARAITVDHHVDARHKIADPVAFDLYLRARHEFHNLSQASTARAVDLFQQALDRTPDDPAVLSGYAAAAARQFFFGDMDKGERARVAVNRAMQLAPSQVEPHVAASALASASGDVVEAAHAIRRAMKCERRVAEAHEAFGRMAVEADRIEVGLEHLRAALELEPRRVLVRGDMARAHELAGRPAVADELLADLPADPESRSGYWMQRSRILLWRRDTQAAEALLNLSGDAAPVLPGNIMLCVLAGRIGSDQLGFLDEQVRGAVRRRMALFRQFKVEAMMFFGRLDEALVALEQAEEAGLFDLAWCMRCPLLAPLRSSASAKTTDAFQTIAARVADRARKVREALGLS